MLICFQCAVILSRFPPVCKCSYCWSFPGNPGGFSSFSQKEGSRLTHLSKTQRIILLCLGSAAAIAALLLLLPLLLPFLLGAAVAGGVRRPAVSLSARCRLPLRLCGPVCVGIFYALFGAVLFFLLRRLLYELGRFSGQLPELLSALSVPLAQMQDRLRALAARVPDGLGAALEHAVDGLFADTGALLGRLTQTLLRWTGRVLSALPELGLFLLTAILSSFFFAADDGALRAAVLNRLPESLRRLARAVYRRLQDAFGGWLRAQLKLMTVTFLLVTAGLFLLHVDYALLPGALIALIDALPLFGAGTVLLPWSLWLLLQGQVQRGFGLLLLYAVTAVTRSTLEPRLLGRHLGLPPLLMLFALYAGYRCLGVAGMLLFPLGAVLLHPLIEPLLPEREA